jgi:hypothetical protein
MSSKLISNLKRVYEDELKGLYDPILLYNVCWDLKTVLGSFFKRLIVSRASLINRANRQFDSPDAEEIRASTERLCHELFLLDTLEAHLQIVLTRIEGSLHSEPRNLMITVDMAIDSMHIDYPLLSHLIDIDTNYLLEWIANRRGQRTGVYFQKTHL